ncbi:hypothetical protein F4561_005597 [Lipingzhangella halophila]|uniref:Uncharacterized protein n=1 Tax=Lipingzhangella halophila TaxID=1783352 RepID=A0A7W7RD62_9ACTN|nr:hypothetical protein [Lipingzhangella halophila]MBB4934703.1 hypothetical protein [Lipingzhangella halophila]
MLSMLQLHVTWSRTTTCSICGAEVPTILLGKHYDSHGI